MTDRHLTADVDGQRLVATVLEPASGARPQVLALHGLGTTSTRHRIRYLLDPIVEHGYGAITFDFSGNGDSTGELATTTLRRRSGETVALARHLDDTVAPVLLGTSMGAHLAAAAVPILRPRGLVLLCPAAYPRWAADAPFDGRSLPRPGPYDDSPAFAGLAEFTGRLLVVAVQDDEVVSRATVDRYVRAVPAARSVEVLRLPRGGHFVHRWLPDRTQEREAVVAAVLRLVTDRPGAASGAQIEEVTRAR
jgi:pimeloyl-ACP methyl ester carboxylesterase